MTLTNTKLRSGFLAVKCVTSKETEVHVVTYILRAISELKEVVQEIEGVDWQSSFPGQGRWRMV